MLLDKRQGGEKEMKHGELIFFVSIGIVIGWLWISDILMDYAATNPVFHQYFLPLIVVGSMALGALLTLGNKEQSK